jgi:predicted GNAT superfamily acetyltransferase
VPSTDQHLSISLVNTLEENDIALGVCRKVWGATAAQDHELYWVIATHGGYLSVARLDGEPVGVSLGLLASRGTELVSHFTAVTPGFAGAGIGFALKQHQREWAASQGIETITWTFDPLVRRNAWFNLVRLGATVRRHVVNYYGALDDDINGMDDSDRFEVAWPVGLELNPSVIVPESDDVLVELPADIEAMRVLDLGLAQQWRRDLRALVDEPLRNGWHLVGMTADYRYVLRPPTKESS